MSRWLIVVFTLAAAGCDEKQAAKPAPSASSTPMAAPSAAPPPATPKVPIVTVEDDAAMIGSDRVDFARPDVKGQIVLAEHGKKIEGETLSIIASRDARSARVALVTGTLGAAKPKAIVIKTAKRDKSTGEISVALGAKREGCAVVGHIAKDGVISVWPASGAKAVTFSHGMAGPDMTRGSDGVRKEMARCDAPYWFVSADPEVKWGLVADLVFAVESPEDAGAPPKAHDVAVLVKATPGRKIDDEP